MASLELKNVVKRYKSQTVLDNLSLSVADGETLVLFGPSGAGKTVLLRMIAGVIDPDEGKILIGGEDMTDVDAEFRGVAMLSKALICGNSAKFWNAMPTPLEARHSSQGAIKSGVESVAKLLKIDHVLSHKPRALSNGQKQRTALARALVGSPPILLLDDPLRNVDAKLRFEMRLELPRLLHDRGATVVYVTQDYKEAMALGNRIAVMSQGVIRQLGTPEQIYREPANVEIASLFGDPTINLLDVKPARDAKGIYVGLSNVQVHLAGAYEAAVGRDCVIGLRPEALSFVGEGTPGAVPVTVEAETPLNEKIVTLVRTVRGREILVSRPAGTPGQTEGKAHIAVDGKSALLFDHASGERIGANRIVNLRSGEAA